MSPPTLRGKPVLIEYGLVADAAHFEAEVADLVGQAEADRVTETGLLDRIGELASRHRLTAYVTLSTADAMIVRVVPARTR